MFDFALTDEQRALRDRAREFAQSEIEPHAEVADRERAIPTGLGEAFHASGLAKHFFTRTDTQAYLVDCCVVTEELAYACAACATYLMLPVFFNRLLLRNVAPGRVEGLQAELGRGHLVTSFAASERAAGSDLLAIAVSAERTATGYRIRGRKEYSTNIRHARQVIVVATGPRADGNAADSGRADGLTWFLVPMDAAGVTVGDRWETFGLRALDVSPVEFADVELDADARLGDEGGGLTLMQANLAQSRTGIAAIAVGIARRARDLVLEFGGRRRVYGQKLTRLQDYRFRIADMEKDIAAARSLVWLSADKHDRGLGHNKEASVAKLYGGEMVTRITQNASLMLGSVGYTGQSMVEKLLRDARHVGIVEGPDPIHREIIFAELLRRGAY